MTESSFLLHDSAQNVEIGLGQTNSITLEE